MKHLKWLDLCCNIVHEYILFLNIITKLIDEIYWYILNLNKLMLKCVTIVKFVGILQYDSKKLSSILPYLPSFPFLLPAPYFHLSFKIMKRFNIMKWTSCLHLLPTSTISVYFWKQLIVLKHLFHVSLIYWTPLAFLWNKVHTSHFSL